MAENKNAGLFETIWNEVPHDEIYLTSETVTFEGSHPQAAYISSGLFVKSVSLSHSHSS